MAVRLAEMTALKEKAETKAKLAVEKIKVSEVQHRIKARESTHVPVRPSRQQGMMAEKVEKQAEGGPDTALSAIAEKVSALEVQNFGLCF
jgi:hypothetical protein